ncbi:NAD(+) diphosphatase [Tessaracoccus sp. OH4464_COT-324]|uniref:NAD(+) diphosphatase n=1 Tax=Tessaracoccus sp. OH4464_COT-324 TaxID=2491059 RepID=UPI001F2C5249|nr:NAD(+) diphosphatase [Tessaracoccus sp. OH4464_COT-324]
MRWDEEMVLDRSPEAGAPRQVLLVTPEGRVAPGAGAASPQDYLLGTTHGVQWFARPVARLAAGTDFREQPTPLVAAAVQLVRWHAAGPRCERCQQPTIPHHHGQRRRCGSCGAEQFCRTDPAIIVRITDGDDRILLARHSSWAEHRFSVIAGFVEPGESLEQACRREAAEEVALQLSDLQYFASQPWPYPRSLMLGFTARAVEAARLRVDGDEIVEASFLTREELASRVAAGSIRLPSEASIARAMIDAWIDAWR